MLAVAGLVLTALVALTRDPTEPGAVVGVVVGFSLAVACLFALVALALEERWANAGRARHRQARRARAVRRGVGLGLVLAALGLLRAVDGLTVVTGGFVVAGFTLAEVVLSARKQAHSG